MYFIPLERTKRGVMDELDSNWEEQMDDLYGPLETKCEELLERNYQLTMQVNSLRDNILSRLGLEEGQELIKKAIGEA
jgi:hypothetical protein